MGGAIGKVRDNLLVLRDVVDEDRVERVSPRSSVLVDMGRTRDDISPEGGLGSGSPVPPAAPCSKCEEEGSGAGRSADTSSWPARVVASICSRARCLRLGRWWVSSLRRRANSLGRAMERRDFDRNGGQ